MNETVNRLRSLTWKRWLQRPYLPFGVSLFKDGIRKEYFAKIGVPGTECLASLYQNGYYYESDEVWEDMEKKLLPWVRTHSVSDATKSLNSFYENSLNQIDALNSDPKNPLEKLDEFYKILTTSTTFIWLTLALENVLTKRANIEVPKYVKTDVDKFIGDASFPPRKNKHGLMEEAMRKGDDPEAIAEKFGWLKVRNGFSKPYTAKEIRLQITELGPEQAVPPIKIVVELQPLFKEIQELVWLRTARTDVFFELWFRGRPLLKEVAAHYKIPFTELKQYTVQSLLAGNPKKFGANFSFGFYRDHSVFQNEPIITFSEEKKTDSVKGVVAFQGIVRGTAKIVREVKDLSKVQKGDILVTQMTFPSFVPGLLKAAAFVTDEGGITCHAAIVAREMRKPCIIGTGHATEVFKDGDWIEVDAEQGIVKKSKRLS